MNESRLSQLLNEKHNWWVVMDHCYARPGNWRPESTFLRPTKTLFMPKTIKRKSGNPLAPIDNGRDDGEIDVENIAEEQPLIYDREKAKNLMEDTEKHAALARVHETDKDDWEANINMTNWSPTQKRLFSGIVNILNNHNLGKLAYENTHNEAICRRTIIDKSVERVRKLFATISWDLKFTQWLHQLLIENLNTMCLASYLEILQTLRSKLPNFVDKFMTGLNPVNYNKLSLLSYESLFPLLKRPWDPVAQSLLQDKPKKLPGNPIVVIVPSVPFNSKRTLKWVNLLSNLGTVITVTSNFGSGHKMTMTTFIDQLFVTTRAKIQDVRVDYPGRNIVLVGFNSGATLALQIAQVEQVLCVICLGFSLYTAEGRRGEPDDNLLELQCPVLFVIGQCSNTALQEDMEELRERMRVETGLIVVGSADNNLRISKKKKRSEGITQSVVDRCITDEVGEFISGVIMSPYPPQIRQSPTNLTTDSLGKKIKMERKRYNSNNSSLDSEPPSPTPRITRPVGRPPGSKSKNKLENKWTTQGILPSPSSSPTPNTLTTPPDTSSNDSFQTDKSNFNEGPPVKKIKTLKPTITASTHQPTTTTTNTIQTPTAKLQGLSNQGRPISNILQSEISTTRLAGTGIKILENVKLNPGSQKLFSNITKNIDLGKISVMSSKNNSNSIVLLPDGKIKTVSPPNSTKEILGRYITSKRQLIGSKPPRPVKKLTYNSQSSNILSPANLTTQDILDLPIIFADDNQIIDSNNTPQPLESTITTQSQISSRSSQIITNQSQITQSPKIVQSTSGNKFVLINNKLSLQNNSNFIISTNNNTVKKPMPSLNTLNKPPTKYAKVVVSAKRTPALLKKQTINEINNLSSEISIKKIEKPLPLDEVMDLENEIASNTVFKSTNDENVTIITNKKGETVKSIVTKSGILGNKPETSEKNTESSSKKIDDYIIVDDN